MIYINAVVDNKSRYTDNLFTYSADEDVKAGDLVSVPFGPHDTVKKAIVCGTASRTDCPADKIKPVLQVLRPAYLTQEIPSSSTGKGRMISW